MTNQTGRRPRVGFQGEPGAFSEAAIIACFGDGGAEPVPYPTFADVFERLDEGAVDVAMVPVENSYAGDVGEVYDLFRRYEVRIRGELQLPVRHCLLALPGASLDGLRYVRSHPQALAQCREFLRRHGLPAEPAYDTAAAARQVAESGRTDLAAIASREAAHRYGLEIMAEDIQDAPDNVTRFYLIEPGRAGDDRSDLPVQAPEMAATPASFKTSILFVGEDRPGALYNCLGAFARREINLTKLTARPDRGRSWQYMFFADLEGSVDEPRVSAALAELRQRATFVRVLGSFPVWQGSVPPAPSRDAGEGAG